ncbi:MAG: FAD-binding oxidoreductase [Alphaproteobacteria bacterium]|nr:FAD-binding oxidoreductase [Alphaproteobacteria bacterium]
MNLPDGAAGVIRSLTAIVGVDNVITDSDERLFYSSDVYAAGATCALAVKPGSVDELARSVKAATDAGLAVVPRGGGMSYTGGYTPAKADSVVFDLRRLDRIVAINTADMYVTVEAGVTWKALNEALKPKGLRTPFFGTLSGIHATVGGSVSQGALFFGSGHFGIAQESVLGLKVVLADGSILPTGQAAHKNAKPFFRHYGPDLTGIFLGDTGALGFKAEITLRLMRIPAHAAYGSFAFNEMRPCIDAMAEIAREQLAVESVGFDPVLQSMRMRRESLMKDVKTFANVVTGQSSLAKGLVEGAKMAVAGRGFMDDVKYSFHLTYEDRTEAGANERLAACRKIVAQFGGREIENTIPKAIRAYPFTPLNNMLGPLGERWLPVHGIFPLSDTADAIAKTHALFDGFKAECDAHRIEWGYMFTPISTHAFVFEPVFYWPDQWMPVQRRTVEVTHQAKLTESPANAAATAAVQKIKTALCAHFAALGAAHLQVGKAYHYRQNRDPQAWALLEKIKTAVDPRRVVNPESLGLS